MSERSELDLVLDQQKILRETLLASHAEKHQQEQRAVEVAMDSAEKRDQEHRIAHEAAHTAHEKIHDAAERAHFRQHESEAEAARATAEAMENRLQELNQLRREVVEDRAQFIRADAHRAELQTLSSRIDAMEKSNDRREGATNAWRWLAGLIGLSGIAALISALLNLAAAQTPPQVIPIP